MPKSTSFPQKRASDDANLTSAAVIRSTPAPMQAPCTAAMTGTGQVSRAVKAACQDRIRERRAARPAAGSAGSLLATDAAPARADKSAPVQK